MHHLSRPADRLFHRLAAGNNTDDDDNDDTRLSWWHVKPESASPSLDFDSLICVVSHPKLSENEQKGNSKKSPSSDFLCVKN